MNEDHDKLYQAYEILRECLGDHGVWADPSRYRRQCWTRDFGLAIQPLLLAPHPGFIGPWRASTVAGRHLKSLEARQRPDGQVPILFLDGLAGHARFLADKVKRSVRDGKVSFMLGRYLKGELGQLTPGTRDSELLYVVAALEHEAATGTLPVSRDSVKLAMRYIKRNLLDSRGLLLGADWRDTMEKPLRDKALLSNNALLCHAYDLMGKTVPMFVEHARLQRKLMGDVFWDGVVLQDWPGNQSNAFSSKQRFDPLGASLAVLHDVVSPERYADVLEGFRSVDTPHGVTIKCRHNPVSAEEVEVIERTDGVVVWPFVVGFAVLAMQKMADRSAKVSGSHDWSKFQFAVRAQFDKLVSLTGFREWYDPVTGEGYGADRQLWSATLYARAGLAVDTAEGRART
jgi:hypothetical protein